MQPKFQVNSCIYVDTVIRDVKPCQKHYNSSGWFKRDSRITIIDLSTSPKFIARSTFPYGLKLQIGISREPLELLAYCKKASKQWAKKWASSAQDASKKASEQGAKRRLSSEWKGEWAASEKHAKSLARSEQCNEASKTASKTWWIKWAFRVRNIANTNIASNVASVEARCNFTALNLRWFISLIDMALLFGPFVGPSVRRSVTPFLLEVIRST